MGQALAQNFKVAQTVFDEVNDALSQKLTTIMWEGSSEELTLTANAQPALMAVSLAVVRVLEAESGLDIAQATYVAGHSLGEYSALAAAGALSLSDTARLLRIRGDAMQAAVPAGQGAMAALIGLEPDVVADVCKEAAEGVICSPANDNGGGQIVVSGHLAAVERAMTIATQRGAKRALLLPVSAPFHCALMQPAADAMRDALSRVAIHTPKTALVANVLADAVHDPEDIRHHLVAQVTGTVRWRESVAFMAAHGVTHFYELGHGKVLAGLNKRIAADTITQSIGNPDTLASFTHASC
jgi:[acyl-carrier-protein] S-malonyltransferase